jgi:hypothetical protein
MTAALCMPGGRPVLQAPKAAHYPLETVAVSLVQGDILSPFDAFGVFGGSRVFFIELKQSGNSADEPEFLVSIRQQPER